MPRVYRIEKCRKPQGTCSKCGKEIKKGDPYLYWKWRFHFPVIRCGDPACYPTRSDLTRSEYLRTVYGLQDRLGAESVEDIESLRDELITSIGELRDEQQEKLDNMPENLRDGNSGSILQERIEACEYAISQLEDIDFDLEEIEPEEGESEEDIGERRQDALDSHFEGLGDQVRDAISELS